MPQTNIRGSQILNNTVQRQDIDTSTTGQALVTKLVGGTNVALSSTGVDAGTGDVTVSVPSAVSDAPSDGGSYARQNGAWVIVQTQKPMVTTSSALPTSGNNYGDMRITRNTGHGWVWTKGSPDAWVDSGALIPVWF